MTSTPFITLLSSSDKKVSMQVIVKRLSTGASLVLRSGFGLEITEISVHQDKSVIFNYISRPFSNLLKHFLSRLL